MSPPQPPTAIDRIAIVASRGKLIEWITWIMIEIGAIFCHVSRISPDVRGVPWVTSGTHKWNGASPIFIDRAMVSIRDEIGVKGLVRSHCPVFMKFIIALIISIMDAVAWIRKYLDAASVDRGFAFFIRMGIIASILISRPIQASSQWELSSVIRVPANRVR